jgi:DNA-binding NarL/FixJ family response regulator
MSRPSAIRIFIADDHPIVRQGLRRIVEADAGLMISGEGAMRRRCSPRSRPPPPT